MNQLAKLQQNVHADLSKFAVAFKANAKSVTKAALPVAAVVGVSSAHAIDDSTFNQATFAYDLYDVAVNQILNGPIGFVGGLITMVISAMNITKNWMLAAGGVLGGTALIRADDITQTLGAII